jgi:four helix bundle protein
MSESILRSKSYSFAVQVVRSVQDLQKNHKEFVLSKQLLRSGTAVGALVSEAEFGQSRADFASKLSIALKEANETRYWLNLLLDTQYLQKENHSKLTGQCTELIRILVASIKTAKKGV